MILGLWRDLKRLIISLWLPLGVPLEPKPCRKYPTIKWTFYTSWEQKHSRKYKKCKNKPLLFRKCMFSLVAGTRPYIINEKETELSKRMGRCPWAWFTGKMWLWVSGIGFNPSPAGSRERLSKLLNLSRLQCSHLWKWDCSSCLRALLRGLNKIMHWKHWNTSIIASQVHRGLTESWSTSSGAVWNFLSTSQKLPIHLLLILWELGTLDGVSDLFLFICGIFLCGWGEVGCEWKNSKEVFPRARVTLVSWLTPWGGGEGKMGQQRRQSWNSPANTIPANLETMWPQTEYKWALDVAYLDKEMSSWQ